ncbi:hypothetical protein [Stomatohabitans albus]|uniref:hypothetical protein n=1 Tax=Stomatohabitans albus TaxID=3110766 RepID=UPI00300D164E
MHLQVAAHTPNQGRIETSGDNTGQFVEASPLPKTIDAKIKRGSESLNLSPAVVKNTDADFELSKIPTSVVWNELLIENSEEVIVSVYSDTPPVSVDISRIDGPVDVNGLPKGGPETPPDYSEILCEQSGPRTCAAITSENMIDFSFSELPNLINNNEVRIAIIASWERLNDTNRIDGSERVWLIHLKHTPEGM